MSGALLLDLTRLQSRAGQRHTGIDRVERAWLDACLAGPAPVYGLLRTGPGYLLLDRSGMARFAAACDSGDWGRADLLSRAFRRLTPAQQAAQSLSRRHAIGRCPRAGLRRMLARHLPQGGRYLNTGHANLSASGLAALRRAGLRCAVLIHDTIPLDLPRMSRPGSAARFEALLSAVACHADRVIVSADTTRVAVAAQLRRLGGAPGIIVAPLGVALPQAGDPPAGLDLDPPFFVALGTIEPRKNHALLLDVWDRLGPGAPRLLICGSRGWNNRAVFDRLDAKPANVVELPGLPDAAVAALLLRARALLFPSLAEGYGLPPLEAAALGTPVVCGDLAICRELLGPRAVYLDPHDRYLWQTEVERLAATSRPDLPRFDPPGWAAHVNAVLGADW